MWIVFNKLQKSCNNIDHLASNLLPPYLRKLNVAKSFNYNKNKYLPDVKLSFKCLWRLILNIYMLSAISLHTIWAARQSYGASLIIWDHTVLPATQHKWTRPALTPARQAGTRFTYPGGMEGWVDLGSLIAARPGNRTYDRLIASQTP